MVSPRHPTTIQNLPCEVLSEIFIRLYAKQIAQMRSVCKPWNALLSDSSFIKSHLHCSIQNNDDILLFFGLSFSSRLHPKPFTARASRSPDLELTNFIKLPVNLQSKFEGGSVIGSVNGLICFVYRSYHDGILLHICNPSLSAVLTLPPFPATFHHLDFGFGFDPKSDDYKILKLTSFFPAFNKVKQAEVYSMRKGSWKLISPQSFPSHTKIPYAHNTQICVDDNLHWLCETDLESKPQTIVAFDLGAETFHEIPLPDSILNPHEDRLNVVGVLSGKLCVMSCVKGGECEVWVMEEYGVAESWVKHHAFSQFGGDIIPYGFTSHREFLFQVGRDDERFGLYDPVGIFDNRFGLYDPVAAKTKTFKIKSINSSVMKFVEYVDSLVWIQPDNRLRM